VGRKVEEKRASAEARTKPGAKRRAAKKATRVKADSPANGFVAELQPIPHGGLFVVVPPEVAANASLTHGARVRGTVDGVAYRSSLMKYSGVFHMGVHKEVARAAGVGLGALVVLTVARDDEPLPTDVVPEDLASALASDANASASWAKLAPATRRGYVKSALDAKKPETRARRIATIVDTLRHGVPARRTWTPKSG
jgi:hypothetical protein